MRPHVILLALALAGGCARAPSDARTILPPDSVDDGDHFGAAVVEIGDLDGDGVGDLAVGSSLDDGGDRGIGSVTLLWKQPDGTVRTSRKLRRPSPYSGVGGPLFGLALAPVGDIDANGTPDLVVGERGGVWTLLLQDDGAILSAERYAPAEPTASFGTSLTLLGDLDGNGINDVVSGAPQDDEATGAAWVIFLDATGRVARHRRIGRESAALSEGLEPGDRFGESVAGLGDLDGDGVADLAVGARHDDDGGPDSGAVWVLFLRRDGGVRSSQKISRTQGGFEGRVHPTDAFGGSLARVGDLDGDGVTELAVAASQHDEGGVDMGAVWVLSLRPDGTVRSSSMLTDGVGGFRGPLDEGDRFGYSLGLEAAEPGPWLLVGAAKDDDGGDTRGAVWRIRLASDGAARDATKISSSSGGLWGSVEDGDLYGAEMASLGDLDGDGLPEVAVAAPGADEAMQDAGAVWILSPTPGGTRLVHKLLPARELGVAAYGSDLVAVGDLDGDGLTELAVGTPGDVSTSIGGSVHLLFLDRAGGIRSTRRIADESLSGGGTLQKSVGDELLGPGDLTGDGIPDLVVARRSTTGELWVLGLGRRGQVQSRRRIVPRDLGVDAAADVQFGGGLASPGDLDGDGVPEIVATAHVGRERVLHVVFLDADGVSSRRHVVHPDDDYHPVIGSAGDLDGDGRQEIVVAAAASLRAGEPPETWSFDAVGGLESRRHLVRVDGATWARPSSYAPLRWRDGSGPRLMVGYPNGPGDEETSGVVELTPVRLIHPWAAAGRLAALGLTLTAAVVAGAVGYARHRTRHLEAQKQELESIVAARTAEIARQASDLEEAYALQSRFLADVSHEFRTPLTLTLGPLEDLLDKPDLPYREVHARIHRNAGRLHRMVGEMLDLSKAEAQALALRPGRFDLAEEIVRWTASFEPLAAQRDTALQLDMPPGPFEHGYDRDHLAKVVRNLLSNALKFTPPGGRVTVRLRRAPDGAAVVSVADTGEGIGAEHLDRLFDRFYRASDHRLRRHDGSGIGLALARELVELHGGTIAVESELGAGSTFTVNLPDHGDAPTIADAPASAPPDAREYPASEDPPLAPVSAKRGVDRGAEPAGPNASQDTAAWPPEGIEELASNGGWLPPESTTPIVLVVDDEDDMRAYVREQLGADYQVYEAADGEQGLQKARGLIPDLIVTDLVMPERSGLELLQAVRTHELTSHVPVIMLTVRSAIESKIEGIESGADAYLAKPFHSRELRARVRTLIEQRRALRARFASARSGEAPALPARETSFLDRVVAAVRAHMDDPDFAVDDLAHAVGMSRRQLYRKLTALTDEAPGVLIRRLRLEHAARMLDTGDHSVKEAAYAVGFRSTNHFAVIFRETYGTTPSAYAKGERSA